MQVHMLRDILNGSLDIAFLLLFPFTLTDYLERFLLIFVPICHTNQTYR